MAPARGDTAGGRLFCFFLIESRVKFSAVRERSVDIIRLSPFGDKEPEL